MASTGGIEASYDFFRLGFVNSGLLSDKAPVQQVMKQHPKAKTYTEKVGLMGEHVKEVLAKDGMDAEQQVLVATKWERSSRVMVYQVMWGFFDDPIVLHGYLVLRTDREETTQ